MNSFRIGRLSIILYKDWAPFEIVEPRSYIHPYETFVHLGFLTLAWEWDMTKRRKKLSGFDGFLNIWKIHLYFFRVPSFGLSGPFWFYGSHYRMISFWRFGIVVPVEWLKWAVR